MKKTPDNGLAVFSGNVSQVEGQNDLQLWEIEPPMPVKVRLYRCDKEFVLEPLREILEITEVYGLLVMDRKEATIGMLEGKRIEMLQKMKKQGFLHKLILNPENLGFSRGNNQGFEIAEGEFFFMLNNDTEVTENWLENLLEKAKEVIIWCNKLKIKTKGFFIIGHPTETLETIDKTIKLACSLKLDDIVTTINTPIPGSQQYAEAEQYGTIDKTNWAEFNYWRPVFVPNGLTKEILLKKHKEIYRKFYLRPRILFRYFLSFFGKGGFKRFITLFKASSFIFTKKSEKQ